MDETMDISTKQRVAADLFNMSLQHGGRNFGFSPDYRASRKISFIKD